MMRLFTEPTLVLASHNKGKIREISELLAPHRVDVKGGPDFHLEEPEENGSTFLENAAIKSRYFAEHTQLPSLADDSGMVVPALNGDPGIYSARWAGPDKDFYMAMERIKSELEKKEEPIETPAYFVCALSLTWPDAHTEQWEGTVHGTLTFPPRGEKGFGYDPIFIPEGYTQTFAEMEPNAKHAISHRANAFHQMVDSCFNGR